MGVSDIKVTVVENENFVDHDGLSALNTAS